jgi:hypothetical protein
VLRSQAPSRHVGFFLGERLYEASISCDIYYVAVSDEKLSELEEALTELGKDDDEVSAVLRRFEGGEPADLATVDSELEALAEGADIAPTVAASTVEARDPQHSELAHMWDGENTEVEIIEPSDDFVLLVDEDDLEELESAADQIPNVTVPPPLPGQKAAKEEDDEDDEEDEGFFKKLFGSRRSSNRP